MLKRSFICFAAAASVAAFFVPSASAATTLGDPCFGNLLSSKLLLQNSVAGGSNPYVVPTDGVITKWGVNMLPSAAVNTERLVVLRPTGATDTYTVVGLSEPGTYQQGTNSFNTRVSAKTGDVITVAVVTGLTLRCATAAAGDVVDNFNFPSETVGATVSSPVSSATNTRVALTATLEPDVDADGFGDETQDLCPQSASYTSTCPLVVLTASGSSRSGYLRVYAQTSLDTTLSIAASVKIGRRTVGFKQLTTATATGKRQLIKLKFPSALRKAVKNSSRKKVFKVKVKATAKGILTDVSKNLTVKVRGAKRS